LKAIEADAVFSPKKVKKSKKDNKYRKNIEKTLDILAA